MENIKKGKIDIDRYRVKANEKVNLKKFPTKRDVDIDKEEVKSTFFPEVIEQLKVYQEKLYAQNTYGLIIVLQAMDAAGKDGTVNHVFANLDPGGVSVASFKQPTTEEKDHDYMWRINKALPPRGNIGIFNRSHYEDVIVTRVHNLISTGQLPRDLIDRNIWMERYSRLITGKSIFTKTAFTWSRFSSTYQRKNSRKGLSIVFLTRKRTGNFPWVIFMKENIGMNIGSFMKSFWKIHPRISLPGILYRRIINGLPVMWSRSLLLMC